LAVFAEMMLARVYFLSRLQFGTLAYVAHFRAEIDNFPESARVNSEKSCDSTAKCNVVETGPVDSLGCPNSVSGDRNVPPPLRPHQGW
jgi:hypothetical protein